MHAIPVTRPFLVLLVLAAAAHGQAPEPAPRDGRRLVYELPVDALQRTLQKGPNRDLEQSLDQMVRTVAARVGDEVSVRRHAASGFTVDVPPKLVPQVAALRHRIEAAGKLEMRIVADGDFVDGPVKFDMQSEKARLEAWLKNPENKKLVHEDPANIRRFNNDSKQGPIQFGKLAWYPRQLRRDPKDKEQWDHPWTTFPALQQATVKVYDDADWNGGKVPDATKKKPEQEQFLVELVALNLRERGFTGEDLEPAGISSGPDPAGALAVLYELKDGLKAEYAAWTEKYIGKASAIVLNGVVQSAPVFRSKIPGVGQISGSFTRQEVDDLVIVLKSGSLPIAPKFVVEEPLPASEFGPRGK